MFTRLPLAILSLVFVVPATNPALCDEVTTAAPQPATTTPDSYYHRDWGIEFGIVPELLRLHVPALGAGHGIVVNQIDQSVVAATALEVGDIVLAAAGVPVRGFHGLPKDAASDLVVLRRGHVMPLGHRSPFQRRQSLTMPTGPSVSTSVFATGNESVSISQNGNEMVIEMSLPELTPAPIRYRGTVEQIQQQVQNSHLSPAARRRVLEAIR